MLGWLGRYSIDLCVFILFMSHYVTMTLALKENPLWPSARLEDQSVCWRFYWLSSTFVGSLLLHLMIVWWYSPWWFFLSNSWWTIYKNLACSNTCYGQNSVKYCKNAAQKTRCPTPRFPGQTNHCLLLIASLSLGRSFTGAQPVHSVPEDCDGKKHGTDVSSMTKGCKRLSWMCTPVSICLKITLGIFHRHVTGCTKK